MNKNVLKEYLKDIRNKINGKNQTNREKEEQIIDPSSIVSPQIRDFVPEKVKLYDRDYKSAFGDRQILIVDGKKHICYYDSFVEGNGCRMYYVVEKDIGHSQTKINLPPEHSSGTIEPQGTSYEEFRDYFTENTLRSSEIVKEQIVGIAIKKNEYESYNNTSEQITYLLLDRRPKGLKCSKGIVLSGTPINYNITGKTKIMRKFDSPSDLLYCLEKDYRELFDIKTKRR